MYHIQKISIPKLRVSEGFTVEIPITGVRVFLCVIGIAMCICVFYRHACMLRRLLLIELAFGQDQIFL